MKIILILLFISNLTFAMEDDPVISIDISYVSTEYFKGLGTYRVIDYNSEVNVCFALEHYQDGTFSGLTSLSKICTVNTGDDLVDLRKDIAGSLWFDDFGWESSALKFNFYATEGVYKCLLKLPTVTNSVPQCELTK